MAGSQIKQSGGLNTAVVELGFDRVKYFEGTITTTPTGFNITPAAKNITIKNTGDTNAVYFNLTGQAAQTSVSFVPGDNIKVAAGCTFTVDFDGISSVSLVTAAGSTTIEGLLGFKGTN